MMQIQVRRAAPGDAAALSDLLAGLSARSSFHRFFAGIGRPSARLLGALLRQDDGRGAWVGADGNALVGHAMWAEVDRAVELGVVVADARQRQGVGRALVAAVLGEAACRGLTDVRLHVHAENAWLVRRLSSGAASATLADGMVTVTRPLADLLPQPTRTRTRTRTSANPHTQPWPHTPPSLIMQRWGSSVIPISA